MMPTLDFVNSIAEAFVKSVLDRRGSRPRVSSPSQVKEACNGTFNTHGPFPIGLCVLNVPLLACGAAARRGHASLT